HSILYKLCSASTDYASPNTSNPHLWAFWKCTGLPACPLRHLYFCPNGYPWRYSAPEIPSWDAFAPQDAHNLSIAKDHLPLQQRCRHCLETIPNLLHPLPCTQHYHPDGGIGL